MTGTESLFWRSVLMWIATLIVGLAMSGIAFANGNPETTRCKEMTNDGKYWEYRENLIAAGTGGASGKGKRGLAKGNNQIKGKGVKEALSSYLRKKNGWSTIEHITNIETLAPKLNGFNSGSGILGYVWLEIARKAEKRYKLDLTDTDELKDNHKIDIMAWGRINKNNVAPNTNENGYAFDKDNGSGHIWASMCFEIRFQGTNNNDLPDAKIAYSLKVEVAECGFKVISRGNGTGNDPVFVGSYMPWTAAPTAGFETKLEAVNFLQGDTSTTCPPPPANGYVTTAAVFFDKDGDENWVDWTSNTSYAHLRNPYPEACVDMFFQTTEPPAALPDDDRPLYCLGRCSNPPLANSGM